MSVDQVKAFMAKVKADEALAKKLSETQAAYKGENGIAEVVIPVAAAAGFNFTVEDFKAAAEASEGEASAEELDKVAGGGLCWSGFGADKVCYQEYGVNF